MNKFITVVMYTLWVVAIVFVLATTFTNFKYTDLNIIASVLVLFALINSLFMMTKT